MATARGLMAAFWIPVRAVEMPPRGTDGSSACDTRRQVQLSSGGEGRKGGQADKGGR